MMSRWKMLIFLLVATAFVVFLKAYPSECKHCRSEDEPLLRHHANSSVEPFLMVDYKLSEDAFNWWKILQAEHRSFSTYKTTVDRLFQMFSPSPDVVKFSKDHYRTCAVVGNSGNLKGSHYGPLINSHDVVIRMNTARVKGYEEDVGNRTTHHFMYPESAVDLDSTTHLVLVPFKIQDLEWLMKALTTGFTGKSYMPVKSRIKANKDLVMVVNPAFMKYVHEIWLSKMGRYPSTGFMALVLAMHICDKVSVFGYGADSDGNWSHYWEKLVNKHLKTGVHPGNHEHDIIEQLAKKQQIRLFRGL
ncbi:CMP-N-acetylneuraminate-beta-galactosamide-alpha-2,3-sialyltransferase 1-like [Pholidichthys leucotaenia]